MLLLCIMHSVTVLFNIMHLLHFYNATRVKMLQCTWGKFTKRGQVISRLGSNGW